MCKVIDVYKYIDSFAPFSTQMSFDNSGLLIGDPEAEVTAVTVALDITPQVMDEARATGAQLVVSHHPIVFDPLKSVMRGGLAYRAVESGLSMICAHTNLDIADGGVNDCLAAAMELVNVRKLGDDSLLRMGELPKVLYPDVFPAYVAEKLGCAAVKFTPTERMIKTVALCGGSGGGEWQTAMEAGADAYVTANIKHNIFLDARRAGFFIADAGHFCTENVVIKPLANRLAKEFPDVVVLVAQNVGDPACYYKR